MLKPVAPSTIDGIKRLAKKLKNELHVPLHEAQKRAAIIAGYQNFAHSQNSLRLKPPTQAGLVRPHRLFVSAIWVDRDAGLSGREVWWIDLTAPFSALLTQTHMREQPAMARLEPRASDHLFHSYRFESQERARHSICHALRTLQFVDATRLRPSTTNSRVYPGGNSINAIPGHDHSTGWYDPVSKGYVFVDEPYERSAQNYASARSAWAIEHAYDVVKPNWPGMYLPGGSNGSRLYLVASIKNGPPLAPLAQALDELPTPPVPESWAGTSSVDINPFVSPGALISQSTKAALTRKPSVREPQVVRPNRMPIEKHEEIGRKLKSVLADTYRRDGVYNRLDRVRSTLDDWIQTEYTVEQLSMQRFSAVYYGDAPTTTFEKSITQHQRDHHARTLEELKSILVHHYSKAFVRKVLSQIDGALKSLLSWK